MNELYLKSPSIEDKEEWLNYVKEFRAHNPKSKPLGCDENINYDLWLIQIENEKRGIALEQGRAPSSVFFLMKEDRVVGTLSLRHGLTNDVLKKYGGHIGYGIRPSERRKGYATTLLHLALEKCQEIGLTDVMVSCKEENIGSAKVIENNYGVLSEILPVPEENMVVKKYWINVEESLEKFNEERNIKSI